MTLADDIINELRQNPGLTVAEITLNIFGRRYPYKQKVSKECRRLVKGGRLERRGNGGQDDPFTYFLSKNSPPASS